MRIRGKSEKNILTFEHAPHHNTRIVAMGRSITNSDLAVFPGWSILHGTPPSSSGTIRKVYVHHPTRRRAHSLTGIKNMINLYGKHEPSLCLKYTDVKLKMKNYSSVTSMVVYGEDRPFVSAPLVAPPHVATDMEEERNVEDTVMTEPVVDSPVVSAVVDTSPVTSFEAVLSLTFSSTTNSNDGLWEIKDSAHMHTFTAVKDEFINWLKDKEKTKRNFYFINNQTDKEFEKNMRCYTQCLYYSNSVPLVTLCSKAMLGRDRNKRYDFVQPPLDLPFTSKMIESGMTMYMASDIPFFIVHPMACFSKRVGTLYQFGSMPFFMKMYSAKGLSCIYVMSPCGTMLSLMTYMCYKGTNHENVIDILTYQSDNKLAKRIIRDNELSKGLGDQMFTIGLIPTLKFNGGGYIYAETVTEGPGGPAWDSHPMSPSPIGNYIWLQLAMGKNAEIGLKPMTMKIEI